MLAAIAAAVDEMVAGIVRMSAASQLRSSVPLKPILLRSILLRVRLMVYSLRGGGKRRAVVSMVRVGK